jgi:hypothetical protein
MRSKAINSSSNWQQKIARLDRVSHHALKGHAKRTYTGLGFIGSSSNGKRRYESAE